MTDCAVEPAIRRIVLHIPVVYDVSSEKGRQPYTASVRLGDEQIDPIEPCKRLISKRKNSQFSKVR